MKYTPEFNEFKEYVAQEIAALKHQTELLKMKNII